jgi:hypothetical protein
VGNKRLDSEVPQKLFSFLEDGKNQLPKYQCGIPNSLIVFHKKVECTKRNLHLEENTIQMDIDAGLWRICNPFSKKIYLRHNG